MDADCVFYTPIIMDVDTVCRLLRSGKNVVTTSGFFHPTETFARGRRPDPRRLQRRRDVVPRRRHTSGLRGDILPLTLARVMSKIEKIRVYEVVNVLTDAPLDHIDWLGFGKEKDKFLSEPTILGLGTCRSSPSRCT